ncbi:MAG: multicopper oxidase domain-containing protein [Planctomycetes bacterium]|nr:multicopper oxidase domain-containing protein [Planctomycetota bacterium]
MPTRREFLVSGAVASGAAMLSPQARGADTPSAPTAAVPAYANLPVFPPGEPGQDYTPVVTPNGVTLPWKVVGGAKIFHLVAEPVEDEFAPGLKAHCWGYNGRTSGPTMEVVEGDRVRIYVTNKLPEATTVHWHGVIVPNGMDGVHGLNQPAIPPGETFRYEFAFPRPGTFMYHPHFDELTQLGMGLNGMIVVHPRQPTQPRPDRDFVIMLNEWFIDPGTSRPNTLIMTDFNLFTFNSKVFPATEPLVARQGDRVRIRFGNLSAQDHHPIHIHGYSFAVVETDGGQLPPTARWPEATVLVPVGAVRTIDFVADNPGDWAVHCHMTHHVMNQMGHDSLLLMDVDPGDLNEKIGRLLPGYMTTGLTGNGGMGEMRMALPPNTIAMKGIDYQFGPIGMGGMVTVLKVRPNLTSYEDPGWYQHPDDTVARRATAQELSDDGVKDTGAKPA